MSGKAGEENQTWKKHNPGECWRVLENPGNSFFDAWSCRNKRVVGARREVKMDEPPFGLTPVESAPDTERAQRAALIQVISKRCIQRPESVGMSYILWPNSRKRTLPSPNTSGGDHGDSPSPKCIVFLFFYGRQEVPAAKNKRRGNPSAAEFSPTSRASQSVTAVQYKTTHREKDVSV